MNEEFIKEIENKEKQEVSQGDVTMNNITWLVFSMNGTRYAIESSKVDEIIRDVEIYKLPFLPAYIEGVINRRGDPFTVINPLIVIEAEGETKLETPLFIVLKRSDDSLCLHISDILFFHETPETDLHMIPGDTDNSYFLGTVDYQKEEILVLNPDAFELLLRKDLGNS